jgi:hypothetical protein
MLAFLAAATVAAAGEWLLSLYGRTDPPYLLVMLLGFAVPLTAAALPTAAISWTLLSETRRLPPGYAMLSQLGFSGCLWAAGRWLRGLYGLDPPYSLFFIGSAMQMIALVIVLGACGLAMLATEAHWRGRRTTR